MNLRYFDLIDQTYDFPQEGFSVQNDYLYFNGVPLKEMIDRFGTPFKMTYLPKIGSQIEKAQSLFEQAFGRYGYRARYVYTYCTKSSHFAHVLREVLRAGSHLELSSAFDTEIVMRLWEKGLLSKETTVLCNGYKTKSYLAGIQRLLQEGFINVVPILDTTEELDAYLAIDVPNINIGIRMATEEEPDFDLYTSRFGIKQQHIGSFFRERIQPNPKLRLVMLHFFIYTGIKDNIYYWTELNKAINLYAHLKQQCPDLHALNLGGGMPIRNSLSFEYDYEYMIGEVVRQIKEVCTKNEIPEPDLYTEFGSFTVGESGAAVYQVLGEKRQNDREIWYLINNSLITTLPDTWGLQKKFILLAVNKWNREYQRVILGGLTCDNDDYYSTEANSGRVHLPRIERYEEPLYIGFFHTGAYQESLGGFGGIQHCLIPSPKHILVDRDDEGNLTYEVFAEEQQPEGVMQTLGY